MSEQVAEELLDWLDRHGDAPTLVERLAVWLDAHHPATRPSQDAAGVAGSGT